MAIVRKVGGVNPADVYVEGELIRFDANGVAEVDKPELLEVLRAVAQRTGQYIIEEDVKEEKKHEEKEPVESASEEKEEAHKKRGRKKAE